MSELLTVVVSAAILHAILAAMAGRRFGWLGRGAAAVAVIGVMAAIFRFAPPFVRDFNDAYLLPIGAGAAGVVASSVVAAPFARRNTPGTRALAPVIGSAVFVLIFFAVFLFVVASFWGIA